MPGRQFKLARQINKLKATEAAERLGVSQPTLSAWEGERKSPGLDNLENMADLYGGHDKLSIRPHKPPPERSDRTDITAAAAGLTWQAGLIPNAWLDAGQCNEPETDLSGRQYVRTAV